MAATAFKRAKPFFACIVGLIAAVISFRRGLGAQSEQFTPVIGKNNTVLFIANIEHGLSNVHVATVYSLLERHPDITIHFAVGSGHEFPVPWRDIPTNIYQMGSFAWTMMFNAELNEKRKFLASHGLKDPINFFNIHQPGKGAFITQHTPAAAIPLDFLPANVTTTGPIVISGASAEEQDPELAAWLAKAPTVLVNLGSLFEYDAGRAQDMAGALKVVMERTDIQVLWKLNRAASLKDEDWKPLVDKFIRNDRLRVSKWLTVDPTALLETGDIVVSVHHGGANCYHEAISTGVPQLILPAWLDLYNYAARVEAIDIGVWGNRQSAPTFSLSELSSAFLKLVDGGSASLLISQNAKKIQRTISRPGRDVAADEIARLAALGH
ncbi:hypothetical protein CNYM01_05429 [Colletotrichum nymphaeae SA-01]|uniref:Erythromycin biosynthesis protein CIII-like C-terminal domain-containing protein n=1 Tax=Colletotrichum nymphaeae SA-01 TaxID=1460502 RepID=A0A135UST7_9PEZI|nr:hypothetical protein CNYM01_05429 [Colletotrichum nymphaeae SA-01]